MVRWRCGRGHSISQRGTICEFSKFDVSSDDFPLRHSKYLTEHMMNTHPSYLLVIFPGLPFIALRVSGKTMRRGWTRRTISSCGEFTMFWPNQRVLIYSIIGCSLTYWKLQPIPWCWRLERMILGSTLNSTIGVNSKRRMLSASLQGSHSFTGRLPTWEERRGLWSWWATRTAMSSTRLW